MRFKEFINENDGFTPNEKYAAASFTDKDGYSLQIYGHVDKVFAHAGAKPRVGTMYIMSPKGEHVKSGYWMDYPETEWNISNKDYYLMPFNDRAALQAKHQATAYKSLKDTFRNITGVNLN